MMLPVALLLAARPASPTILESARAAISVKGGTAWAQTHLTGHASYYGVKDQYDLTFRAGGSYLERFDGPISETFGSNGTAPWQIDRSRGVEKLDFEDRDRQLAVKLLETSDWVSPAEPITVTAKLNELKIKFSSGQVETVRMDPKTKLPTGASFPISSGTLTIKLSGWKPAGDRRIPTHVEVTEAGLSDVIDVEQIAKEPPGLDAYSMPHWEPNDIDFDASKPARVEAKIAPSGHVLVHPLVNGKDVGWFILDSGAEIMVLDRSTADEMKLPKIGREPLTGVGGTVQVSFRPVDEFVLGPATMKGVLFTEFDLAQLNGLFGVKVGGVVGADFLRRAIVAIDFKTPDVEVRRRDAVDLPSVAWRPLRFSTGNPAVEATMSGAPKAWYRFDTGANGTVTIHAPFVRKYRLLEGRATSPAGLGGVGGTLQARAGTIKWFELGGHRFVDPTVIFATEPKGALAEPYLAGNIGMDFMRPFHVYLDFSGYRIALVPW